MRALREADADWRIFSGRVEATARAHTRERDLAELQRGSAHHI
jgi:hypothetical protein